MFRTNLTAGINRMVRPMAVALAGAAGLALAVAPTAPAQAATGCATASCITNLSVQRHGLSMGTTFDTTVNTKARLYVYQDGTRVASGSDLVMRRHHKVTSSRLLQANTSYNWNLVVTDASGRRAERTGSVTTLHRRVTVMFSTDTVTNDSDDGGSGEFHTWVGMPGTTVMPILTPEDINTGDTVNMAQVAQQQDAATTTLLHTEMYDNDFTVPGLPTVWPSKPGWTSGSSYQGDWATASTTLDTRAATNGQKPFEMSVSSNVGFIVHGWYSVDFVS